MTTKKKVKSRRKPIYDKIFTDMKKLRGANKSVIAKRPRGVDASTFHNRLNAALVRADIQPVAGCRWKKRTRPNGDIEISLARL